MLELDKNTVDFLVTDDMVQEIEYLQRFIFSELDLLINEMAARTIDQVLFVACGSPLSACKTTQLLFEKYSSIPSKAYSGWDFLDTNPAHIDEKTLLIGVSHYGKTEEVVDSLALGRKRGAMTIAVTRDASGTPLVDAAEYVVGYKGECIWEMHLLITYYLACSYINHQRRHREVEKILSDMKKLPSRLKRLVKEVENKSKDLGLKASVWPFVYTVSSGPLMPLAYKEGVITMMEFTWTHGAALNSAEFRHGPLEIVEDGVPYVFLLGNDESRHTTERALRFVKRYSDQVVVFDVNDYAADLHPMLSPMILFVPLEFFYYYLSVGKGHNPDDRRYYGGLVEY